MTNLAWTQLRTRGKRRTQAGKGSRPPAKLVVELSASGRINSIGIAHLVKLVTIANTHGSRVVLAAPAPFLAGVFGVTRLNRFFDLAETRAAALSALDT